jgi:hypothetical protein
MTTHLVLIGVPVVDALLIRMTRHSRRWPTAIARDLRDLLTLRMVLRDTEPEQRSELLAAHRDWRTEPGPQFNRTRVAESELSMPHQPGSRRSSAAAG